MKRRFVSLAAGLVALALAKGAQADIFLKVSGIEGDVTALGHEKEIQVLSLAFSGGQTVPKGGPKPCAPPKKTQISAITLQKLADVASPKLFMAAAEGTIFANDLSYGNGAVITVTKATSGGIEDTFSYGLRNAYVSSYQVGSTGDRPTETIELTFAALTFSKLESPPDSATWSVCGTTP